MTYDESKSVVAEKWQRSPKSPCRTGNPVRGRRTFLARSVGEGSRMAHFAKPWFRKGRGWFLEINGKQVKLGDERDESFARYHQLMAGQSPSANQVSGILDAFLDWCALHR